MLPQLSQTEPKTMYRTCILINLVVVGILAKPHVGKSIQANKALTKSENALTQVANYYLANRCPYRYSERGFRKGDIIANPEETSCYMGVVNGYIAQWLFVESDPNTQLVKVSGVFSEQQLNNRISEIQEVNK
jgi:hypothetical protein